MKSSLFIASPASKNGTLTGSESANAILTAYQYNITDFPFPRFSPLKDTRLHNSAKYPSLFIWIKQYCDIIYAVLPRAMTNPGRWLSDSGGQPAAGVPRAFSRFFQGFYKNQQNAPFPFGDFVSLCRSLSVIHNLTALSTDSSIHNADFTHSLIFRLDRFSRKSPADGNRRRQTGAAGRRTGPRGPGRAP